MNTLITIVVFILSLNYSFAQEKIKTIKRENFVGQKIKFLKDNDTKFSYQGFGKNTRAYPTLEYSEYMGRIATFTSIEDDVYTLAMDDNSETIYFKLFDFAEVPNNVGFVSILDSARKKYLGKELFNESFEKCKIIAIEFAEDDGKYSQLYGAYNLYYIIKKDTLLKNLTFSETYAAGGEYTYDHEKRTVFDNIFVFKNPFTSLTRSNINDKFFIDIDKMENVKTYINKNLIDKELIKYDLGYSLDYKLTTILTKVSVINGAPKISFMSNYYGRDWIFHSYIKVMIGGIKKQTTPVKSKTEILSNGTVIETCYYNLATDLTILKWIAENYTKEVTVRFYGRDFYEDNKLPMPIKLSIKETYDLFNLLKAK